MPRVSVWGMADDWGAKDLTDGSDRVALAF